MGERGKWIVQNAANKILMIPGFVLHAVGIYNFRVSYLISRIGLPKQMRQSFGCPFGSFNYPFDYAQGYG